jgi:DNA-binding IclR family transcriptional regulator
MAEVTLEPDKFCALYDGIHLVSEKAVSEPLLALALGLSQSSVERMVSFMISERLLKTSPSGDELRLTRQGFDFLQAFSGIRKFLS